jgi:hypothetical protein
MNLKKKEFSQKFNKIKKMANQKKKNSELMKHKNLWVFLKIYYWKGGRKGAKGECKECIQRKLHKECEFSKSVWCHGLKIKRTNKLSFVP